MKAIVLTGYGKTEEVVELRELPDPEFGPNDVLIDVHAASVNPIDFKVQQGAMKSIRKLSFPAVMGFDVSGVVQAVGARVSKFKIGDAVFSRVASDRMGTFAERVASDEKYVAMKPANISHQEAAAIPLVALTTWQALFDRAGLKAGQKVLIHAGAGGIGTQAIQIAKQAGAFVATTTSTGNVDLVKSLGADLVVDYKKQPFDEVIKGYDVVFETLGGDNQKRSFGVLKPGGKLVSVVGVPKPEWARRQKLPFFMPWIFAFMNRDNDALGKKFQVSWDTVLMEPSGEQLATIGQWVTDGKLKPVIDKVFPLAETKQALLYSQSGRAKGKIVINMK